MSTGAGAAGDNTDVSATKPISVLPSARATLPRQTDPDEPARILGAAAGVVAARLHSTAARAGWRVEPNAEDHFLDRE